MRISRRSVTCSLLAGVLGVALVALSGAALAGERARSPRTTVSDKSVEPGQIVEVTVKGSMTRKLVGGPATYIERQSESGWEAVATSVWYGTGEPTLQPPDASVAFVRVDVTSFPVAIPDVSPGQYRISRTYSVEGSDSKVEAKVRIQVR